MLTRVLTYATRRLRPVGAETQKAPLSRGFPTDGETRTRTGDTTIFRRGVLTGQELEPLENTRSPALRRTGRILGVCELFQRVQGRARQTQQPRDRLIHPRPEPPTHQLARHRVDRRRVRRPGMDIKPRPRHRSGHDRITSYLPSAHIADRWSSHYNSIVYGVQVTTVADPRTVAAVLPQVRPTIWGGVPRVVEKLKSGVTSLIAGDPDVERRTATQAAIQAGIERVRLEQAGEVVPTDLAERFATTEPIRAALRERLGFDQVRWIMIGAAPLSSDVHEFLLGVGLPVLELYGLSECSCVVTVSSAEQVKIGSVGRFVPGLEHRLADDGELLLRGPTVMRGYRGQPEMTAEVIDAEGWLHTGDIAAIGEDGYVRIVDRKKELIISAGGKNMSPANIEHQLKAASPLIGQAAVVGDRRPYNVALLVLDPDAAAGRGAAEPELRAEVAAAVEHANSRLSRVEQIKRYELLPREWLPGGDELTPTMKLKRSSIAEKYATTIDRLYRS
jgi:long-chain acyl-CoA synthetase